MLIHESSYVETGNIGEGTKIWHFCHIDKDVLIGKNCVIGQGCYIAGGVRIGDNCHIQNGVSLFGGIILGNDVFIGPHAVFTNVRKPSAKKKQNYERTFIKDGAVIGAGACIRCGVVIGKDSFVGMGAIILKDVKDGQTVVGKGEEL